MTPSAPHAPPRPKEASARIWGEPPDRSTVFNLPSAKNAMERPSKDQKGKMESSVPRSWRASRELTGRIQIEVLPSTPVAANATLERSSERTGGPAVSPVRLTCACSGGLMAVRIDGPGAGRCRRNPAMMPKTMATRRAAIQPGRDRGSCDCWLLGGNPLLFELDIVRSLVTLFGIFLQAGPDDVVE